MIRLTGSGRLIAGVCAILYFASMTSQSSLLLVPVGILLGCFVVNAVVGKRRLRAIQVTPPEGHTTTQKHEDFGKNSKACEGKSSSLRGFASSWAFIEVTEGTRASQPWRVHNSGAQPAAGIEVWSDLGQMLSCPALPPKSTLSLTSEFLYARRGVFQCDRLELRTRFPYGFVEARRTFDTRLQITVHPAVYPTTPPAASEGAWVVGGKKRGNRRTAHGVHFAGIRPMLPEDSLKQVHWPSSAKGRGLMAKTFEEELAGRVAVVLDWTSENPEHSEQAIRAAGSLVFAALDAGDHVTLILPGQSGLGIPPFADGREVLDRLAVINTTIAVTEAQVSAAVAALPPRAGVALVLGTWRPPWSSWIDRSQGARRRLSLYLPADSVSSDSVPAGSLFHFREGRIDPAHQPAVRPGAATSCATPAIN